MKNVIFAVAGGFYIFGTEIESSQEGYLQLIKGSMFRGFGGGRGLPGVSCGANGATATLDMFDQNEVLTFPLTAVYAIFPSIDLYTFSGTTLG